MDSHAIVTEAGSLVLAALACIADNSIPILALTVVSWLITSAIASEKLTTTCTSLVLDFAGTAARHYRLIENGLEEVWYTVAEAPEDAAAYLKRAVVSLTPMVVRDFVVRSASFRVEAGHLVHAIGFFVLFFRLAPGSDKKRFQRSWSLATAVYLASVDVSHLRSPLSSKAKVLTCRSGSSSVCHESPRPSIQSSSSSPLRAVFSMPWLILPREASSQPCMTDSPLFDCYHSRLARS